MLAGVSLSAGKSEACTRILYETANQEYFVGRNMDWFEDTMTDLWVFPRGMARDGAVAENPVTFFDHEISWRALRYQR